MIYTCYKCGFVNNTLSKKEGNFLFLECKKCGAFYKLRRYKLKTFYDLKEVNAMSEIWLSIPELAKKVNTTPGYIRYCVRMKKIPFYEIMGHVKFKEKDMPDIMWWFDNFAFKRGVKRK